MGFRPIILETLIMRYGLKGKSRIRPDFFRVVLGPCAQFSPCEDVRPRSKNGAKHQNLNQNILTHFGQIFAKFLAEMGSQFLEAYIKNPSPLGSLEFSLLTAAKRIMEKN